MKPSSYQRRARCDLESAVEWYAKDNVGVAIRFDIAVKALVDEIASNPKQYAIVEADVRQAIMIGFPYSIYYRILPRKIDIIAVHHNSRDPDSWKNRI